MVVQARSLFVIFGMNTVDIDNQTDSNLTSSPTVVTEQPCNNPQTNSSNHLT